MQRRHMTMIAAGLLLAAIGLLGFIERPNGRYTLQNLMPHPENPEGQATDYKKIPDFVNTGLDWLVQAQFENGGWGSGQSSAQGIRDPKAVKIDPATTAFAGMALLRTGNTLSNGKYSENLKKALFYLLEMVEKSPEEGHSITDLTGTQPQAKLGQHIDLSMCAQFFGKILPYAEQDAELKGRIEKSLDKCVAKLQGAQQANGSWNSGGWAPVLQSAMANSALEQAQAVGRTVDDETLNRSQNYQRDNLNTESKGVRTDAGAGVALYAVTANQRTNANDVQAVNKAVKTIADSIRATGAKMEDIEVADLVTTDNFVRLGFKKEKAEEMVTAYSQNNVVKEMIKDEKVLAGFGNNGGEEFLSFMMTSESLAMEGGTAWDEWYTKMNDLFTKIQNGDGSWSGHHCITSPVFCTAAVIMAMTADRDAEGFKID